MEKLLGSVERIEFSDIHESKIGLDKASNDMFVTVLQVKVDDAEPLGIPLHEGKHGGAHLMNAGKGQELVLVFAGNVLSGLHLRGDAVGGRDVGGIESLVNSWKWTLHLTGLDVGPSHQSHGVVKDEITLRVTLTDEQRGVPTLARLPEGLQVDIAEDVDVVNEETSVVAIHEQRRSMTNATTRFEKQLAFVGKMDVEPLKFCCLAPLLDHVGKMMHIDDDVTEASAGQLVENMLQQRFASNGHQGLGHGVGEGLESRAETGSKDHGFHFVQIKN